MEARESNRESVQPVGGVKCGRWQCGGVMDAKEVEEAMLRRMQAGQFRFANLYEPYGSKGPEYRQADRLIQRERKAGNIAQVSRGLWNWVGNGR